MAKDTSSPATAPSSDDPNIVITKVLDKRTGQVAEVKQRLMPEESDEDKQKAVHKKYQQALKAKVAKS